MKIQVIKDGQGREIKPTKLAEYLAAGWSQPGQEKVEEVSIMAVLKPAAVAKAAVNQEPGNKTNKGVI